MIDTKPMKKTNNDVDIAASREDLAARSAGEYQMREQRRKAALQAIRAAVRTVLPRFPGIRRAYVFGSVVRRGAMRAGAHIDLAIEGSLQPDEYFALWRDLEHTASHWPIDLVELNRDPRFAAHVRERGVVIYERTDTDIERGVSE